MHLEVRTSLRPSPCVRPHALVAKPSLRGSSFACSSSIPTSLPSPESEELIGNEGGAQTPLITQFRLFQKSLEQAREKHYGGLGLSSFKAGPLAAMCAVVPPVAFNGTTPLDLLTNRVFVVGFIAWFLAQFGKIFTHRFKNGVWDVKKFWSPGGMPSSHSSLVMGVTVAIAMQHGFNSSLFAMAVAFSLVVMYDAMGVRRHAGKQAEVLNQVVVELMDEDHPLGSIKLKEVLGHTPRQVFCGAIVGVVAALITPLF